MANKEFDPLSYIEDAFLDTEKAKKAPEKAKPKPKPKPKATTKKAKAKTEKSPPAKDTKRPKATAQTRDPSHSLVDAIRKATNPKGKAESKDVRLKKTKLRAPRPRRRKTPARGQVIPKEMEEVWAQIPKNLKFLASVYDDSVTEKYYTTEFREPREELIRRLVDPVLSLEEASRLLGVCPATVRRYTNRGWLRHHRTGGNQRRFRLSGIVAFIEEYGRNPE